MSSKARFFSQLEADGASSISTSSAFSLSTRSIQPPTQPVRRKGHGLNNRFNKMLETMSVLHQSPKAKKKPRLMSKPSPGSSARDSGYYDGSDMFVEGGTGARGSSLGPDFSVIRMNVGRSTSKGIGSGGRRRGRKRAHEQSEIGEEVLSDDSVQMRPRAAEPLPSWLAETFSTLSSRHPLRKMVPSTARKKSTPNKVTEEPDHALRFAFSVVGDNVDATERVPPPPVPRMTSPAHVSCGALEVSHLPILAPQPQTLFVPFSIRGPSPFLASVSTAAPLSPPRFFGQQSLQDNGLEPMFPSTFVQRTWDDFSTHSGSLQFFTRSPVTNPELPPIAVLITPPPLPSYSNPTSMGTPPPPPYFNPTPGRPRIRNNTFPAFVNDVDPDTSEVMGPTEHITPEIVAPSVDAMILEAREDYYRGNVASAVFEFDPPAEFDLFKTPGPGHAYRIPPPVYFDSPTEDPVDSDPMELSAGHELDYGEVDFSWSGTHPTMSSPLPDDDQQEEEEDPPSGFRDEDLPPPGSEREFSPVAEEPTYSQASHFEPNQDHFCYSLRDHHVQSSQIPMFPEATQTRTSKMNRLAPSPALPARKQSAFAPAPGIYLSPLRNFPSSPSPPPRSTNELSPPPVKTLSDVLRRIDTDTLMSDIREEPAGAPVASPPKNPKVELSPDIPQPRRPQKKRGVILRPLPKFEMEEAQYQVDETPKSSQESHDSIESWSVA